MKREIIINSLLKKRKNRGKKSALTKIDKAIYTSNSATVTFFFQTPITTGNAVMTIIHIWFLDAAKDRK